MSGAAVQISAASNEVVLAADVQGRTSSFQLVRCRGWSSVADELRSSCFALMDASRPDHYWDVLPSGE